VLEGDLVADFLGVLLRVCAEWVLVALGEEVLPQACPPEPRAAVGI